MLFDIFTEDKKKGKLPPQDLDLMKIQMDQKIDNHKMEDTGLRRKWIDGMFLIVSQLATDGHKVTLKVSHSEWVEFTCEPARPVYWREWFWSLFIRKQDK